MRYGPFVDIHEINFWAMLSALALFIGGVLGAIGASSLWWNSKNHQRALRDAYSPRGSNKAARKKISEPAKEELKKRDLRRDGFSLLGWAFVIIGSGLAVGAALYPAATVDKFLG